MDIEQIFGTFKHHNKELYYVGGYVRDSIMHKNAKDIDMATNATVEEMGNMNINSRTIGFATVTVPSASGNIEITTYRKKEEYKNGSRTPQVILGNSIFEDLHRRDFTINAIAMTRNYKLIDPCNGIKDIKRKVINTPDDPLITFKEDPLRMLRAARFISELGFYPHPRIIKACKELKEEIMTLPAERLLIEMDRILIGKDVVRSLKFLVKTELMRYLIPEIYSIIDLHQNTEYHCKDVWNHTLDVINNTPAIKNLRWAALFHDIGKASTFTAKNGKIHFYYHEIVSAKVAEKICDAFKMANKDKKEIVFLVKNHMRSNSYNPRWKNSTVWRLVKEAGEYLDNLLLLSQADITSHNKNKVSESLANLAALEKRIKTLKKETKKNLRVIDREIFKKIIKEIKIKDKDIKIFKEHLESEILNGNLEKNKPAEYYIFKIETNNYLSRRE